jgi:hypothetical protein
MEMNMNIFKFFSMLMEPLEDVIVMSENSSGQ